MTNSNTLCAFLVSTALAGPVWADQVEITLVDDLDGQLNGYCLDIVGGGRNIDPSRGLQGHTCYSYQGQLGRDQIYDTDQFADNTLYMPEFDVCVEMAAIKAGADIGLTECNGSERQQITIANDGHITPANQSNLCFTLGADTRSGNNPVHLIKALTLEPCSDESEKYQTWRSRSSDD